MTKRLFTELDQKKLDAGIDWKDKYEGVELMLVCLGLKPDVVNDVTTKGYDTYEPGDFFEGHEDFNVLNVILNYDVNYLDRKLPDDVLMYVQNPGEGYDLTQAWESTHLVAGIGADLGVDNLVFPITSISKRVELSELLEREIQAKYDMFLDCRVMGGPVALWKEFFSLYKSLADSGMIEHATITSRNLCLNLFAAFFPEKFKFINIKSKT